MFTAADWATPATVTVTSVRDDDAEDAMTTVSHQVEGADYTKQQVADVVVRVADLTPRLAVAGTAVAEGAGAARFVVSLDQTSTQEVTVAFATSDGTARAGSDYTAAGREVDVRAQSDRAHDYGGGSGRYRSGSTGNVPSFLERADQCGAGRRRAELDGDRCAERAAGECDAGRWRAELDGDGGDRGRRSAAGDRVGAAVRVDGRSHGGVRARPQRRRQLPRDGHRGRFRKTGRCLPTARERRAR